MNLFFQIALAVIGFGGGIVLILKYRENEEGIEKGFLALLSVMGAVIVVWGGALQFSDSPQVITGKGGPASGWQLVIVGLLICILSGYFAIRKNST